MKKNVLILMIASALFAGGCGNKPQEPELVIEEDVVDVVHVDMEEEIEQYEEEFDAEIPRINFFGKELKELASVGILPNETAEQSSGYVIIKTPYEQLFNDESSTYLGENAYVVTYNPSAYSWYRNYGRWTIEDDKLKELNAKEQTVVVQKGALIKQKYGVVRFFYESGKYIEGIPYKLDNATIMIGTDEYVARLMCEAYTEAVRQVDDINKNPDIDRTATPDEFMPSEKDVSVPYTGTQVSYEDILAANDEYHDILAHPEKTVAYVAIPRTGEADAYAVVTGYSAKIGSDADIVATVPSSNWAEYFGSFFGEDNAVSVDNAARFAENDENILAIYALEGEKPEGYQEISAEEFSKKLRFWNIEAWNLEPVARKMFSTKLSASSESATELENNGNVVRFLCENAKGGDVCLVSPSGAFYYAKLESYQDEEHSVLVEKNKNSVIVQVPFEEGGWEICTNSEETQFAVEVPQAEEITE